jgi:uncharacterized damage-inducible protein DinB
MRTGVRRLHPRPGLGASTPMPANNSLRTVRRLLDYNHSVFGRFERSLQRRPWKELTANRGIGHLSLKNTLVHILNVEEAWLVAIAQKRWEVFEAPGRRPDDVSSWKELRAYRDRVRVGVDVLMSGLTEKRLQGRVEAPWMPGTYTLEDAFFQVTIEQAHHLGEIIAASWQRDRASPDMTWIENLPRKTGR